MKQLIGFDRNLLCFLNDHTDEPFTHGDFTTVPVAEIVLIHNEVAYSPVLDSDRISQSAKRVDRLGDVRFHVNPNSLNGLIGFLEGVRSEFEGIIAGILDVRDDEKIDEACRLSEELAASESP